ncbi:MAG TPA: hypothetical protein VK530_03865, partial [Candidatus Acidoferrum sp.]|nr:hypothetical protein [Candidatus Acidoferrum sp.]
MKNSFAVALLFMTVAAALAQNNPAVSQADTTRTQRDTDKVLRDLQPGDDVPSLYADEDADVGPQTILREKKQTWFRGLWDGQLFYTDNMNFAERDEREAVVAVNTLEAAITPPACITRFASFRPEIGYRHQFFNYLGGDGRNDFDFDSSTVFAGILAQTKHYQMRVGGDYMRLIDREDDGEFYREYVPRWSLQRNFRVCERSMFSVSYLGSYHFTREDAPDITTPPFVVLGAIPDDRSERWEHTFIAAYSVALPCKLVAQPFYRFQLNDFANTDESYDIHTVGFSLGWFPCAN